MNKSRLLIIIYIVILLAALTMGTLAFSFLFDKEEEVIVEPEETIEEIQEIEIICRQFAEENFVLYDDYLYYEDYRYTSKLGIDISEFSGTIDFDKVKKSGIDFVIMRLGRRGYSSGLVHPDAYYYKYIKQAIQSGLKVGVYFFSQAINEEEAIEEAQYVLDTLNGLELEMGISYDFEEIGQEDARGDKISMEQASRNAVAFFDTIGEQYDVYLYTSTVAFRRFHEPDLLKKYPLWYAQYYILPECPYNITLWQYTDNGHVDGIDKPVDMDILFIKK